MLEIADKVIDGIKAVREIARRIQNAELQSQIANLMVSSADLKMEIADLKSEILRLREENSTLKKKADLRAKMRVEKRMLYPREEIPGYGSGPFCPICFEKDGYLLTLWQNRTTGRWLCDNCKSVY